MPILDKRAAIAAFAVTVAAGTMVLGPPASAQSSPPSGEQLFRQRCQACHSVVAGRPAGVGPNLAGVVGRKAASTRFAYSAALKGANLTWTRTNLDRYLAAPARTVPGTKMAMAVTDQAQRAAVIQYLSRAR